MPTLKKSQITRKGFTIAEVMVATTLFSMVAAALAVFMVETSTGVFWVAKKSLITNDVRHFTQRITQETLGSNTGFVYASYDLNDRNEKDDRRQSGQTGDCLVLIHYDPYPNIEDRKHYTKLIIYYRQPNEDGESPVYRKEISFNPPQPIDTSAGYDHFEQFLKKYAPLHKDDTDIVLELSRGLADGNLFRDYGNNTFILNGEILHGNKVKEVTNTYNLTISPRG